MGAASDAKIREAVRRELIQQNQRNEKVEDFWKGIEKQLDGWFEEHRRDGWRHGMLDGLLLGFVAGVGFTFVVFWVNFPHP